MSEKVESQECRTGFHMECLRCPGCPCHPKGSRSRAPIDTNWAVTDLRGASWRADVEDPL